GTTGGEASIVPSSDVLRSASRPEPTLSARATRSVPLASDEPAEGDEADDRDDDPDQEAPEDRHEQPDDDEDAAEPDSARTAPAAIERHADSLPLRRPLVNRPAASGCRFRPLAELVRLRPACGRTATAVQRRSPSTSMPSRSGAARSN